MPTPTSSSLLWSVLILSVASAAGPAAAQSSTATTPRTIEHRVPVRSTVPAIEGQMTELYVRERVLPATLEGSNVEEGRVVLFVHGAGTPAEVAFDVPYATYSWMAHLASAGFDVFSVDMTGYGRSTRPPATDDPCNLDPEQQAALIPAVLETACDPTYPFALTTIASDWNDIDAAVEYIRELRGVDRVSLIAWSLGGPRAGGYAAQHPERVDRLVLLAPAYSRSRSDEPPALPAPGTPMTLQDEQAFRENWDRQVGCTDQYLPLVRETVWKEMLLSDPVGASWGHGYRRAPRTTTWGWGQETVRDTRIPTLLISPPHDGQVPPERVRELYEDLGSPEKVLVDLACTSHNAMWETNHLLMFEASREWLQTGSVQGTSHGILRLGY